MSRYSKKMTLPWQCHQLFELAADIARYPEFLPGWKQVTILRRSDNKLLVEQKVGLGLVKKPFVSEAELIPCKEVKVHSNDGPFHYLNIHWMFEPMEDGGCQVCLHVDYAMKNRMLDQLSARFFKAMTSDVVDRFRKEARKRYGPGSV
ncbi:MAG: type II toxin-antitoxin system RatA family toxin [Gammaproteobacteria bacterium]|nr:type II toxin-antitoxin system RatA family toxin [Gammaproteobacteria bacterium]